MKRSLYSEAGVNIDAKAAALTRARDIICSTFTPGVLGGWFDVGAQRRLIARLEKDPREAVVILDRPAGYNRTP